MLPIDVLIQISYFLNLDQFIILKTLLLNRLEQIHQLNYDLLYLVNSYGWLIDYHYHYNSQVKAVQYKHSFLFEKKQGFQYGYFDNGRKNYRFNYYLGSEYGQQLKFYNAPGNHQEKNENIINGQKQGIQTYYNILGQKRYEETYVQGRKKFFTVFPIDSN